MKQVTTDGVMLKRLNFGEADRIITMLTPDQGKISILAKGVRRSKSKLAGGLELFSLSTITYIDGKSDLKTVISTKLKVHYDQIVSDVGRTMHGYDFLKAIDSFTEHTHDPAYYQIIETVFDGLNNLRLDGSVVATWFYARVLQVYGGGVNVEKPLQDSQFREDKVYGFSYDDMSFMAHPSGQFRPNHIKYLRLILRSDNPGLLANIEGGAELAQDLLTTLKQSTLMHKA